MRHPLRSIAVQGAWYAAGSALVKVSGLILLPVLTNTRFLSVADYGFWGVLEVSAQIAVATLGLALSVGLVRFYNEPWGGDRALAATWWMTAGIAGLIAVVGGVAVARFAPVALRPVYAWLLVHTAGELLLAVPLAYLRARERALVHTLVQGLKLALLVSIALVLMVRHAQGLAGLTRALGISTGATLVIAVLWSKHPAFFGRALCGGPLFDRTLAVRLLKFSVPLVLGGLGSMVLNAGDRYVLAGLRPPEDLAYYSLASRFGGVVNMLAVQPLNLAWMPLLFRLREDQRPGVLRLLVPYLAIALCAAVIVISIFAAPVLHIMSSDPVYAERAVPLIPWVGFGFAAFGLAVVTTGVLALFHRTRIVSLCILLVAALNIALNFALVPRFGPAGSAVATLVSYLALDIAHFRLIASLVPNRYPWGRIFGVAAVSAAAAFAGALRPYTGGVTDWCFRGGLLAAWAAALLVTRWFTIGEMREIVRVMRGPMSRP
jgi:O-antigen/teichoic acid export membrane protein